MGVGSGLGAGVPGVYGGGEGGGEADGVGGEGVVLDGACGEAADGAAALADVALVVEVAASVVGESGGGVGACGWVMRALGGEDVETEGDERGVGGGLEEPVEVGVVGCAFVEEDNGAEHGRR